MLCCSAAYLLTPSGCGATALWMAGALTTGAFAAGALAGAGGLAAGALGAFLGALGGRTWSASTTAGITIRAFFFSSFLGQMAWELSICKAGQQACQHRHRVSKASMPAHATANKMQANPVNNYIHWLWHHSIESVCANAILLHKVLPCEC
jgi:hypothetical protein